MNNYYTALYLLGKWSRIAVSKAEHTHSRVHDMLCWHKESILEHLFFKSKIRKNFSVADIQNMKWHGYLHLVLMSDSLMSYLTHELLWGKNRPPQYTGVDSSPCIHSFLVRVCNKCKLWGLSEVGVGVIFSVLTKPTSTKWASAFKWTYGKTAGCR